MGRAPIAEGGGYAWFANRGIGRPVAESLADTMAWFGRWLVLSAPGRYAGAAILHGTLPFDAGVPVTPGRLAGVPVLVAQGETDTVIPRELLDRTWSYLHHDSGAVVQARHDPGGHAISAQTLTELGDWITEQVG